MRLQSPTTPGGAEGGPPLLLSSRVGRSSSGSKCIGFAPASLLSTGFASSGEEWRFFSRLLSAHSLNVCLCSAISVPPWVQRADPTPVGGEGQRPPGDASQHIG